MSYEVICADVLDWAAKYDGPKFHALFCDPPWEYAFMGKSWDDTGVTFQPGTWAALAEHLLPGAFLMVFAGSRGWHRLACAMEDAGLILQPSIFVWGLGVVEVPLLLGHLQAQSFPKATRIKAKEFEAIGESKMMHTASGSGNYDDDEYDWGEKYQKTKIPATDLARAWEGHRYGGQVLKDALTPIIVAQKPWEGKRLDCIVETGAGSLWVDGGRVGTEPRTTHKNGNKRTKTNCPTYQEGLGLHDEAWPAPSGRWPSNFALVHAPGCVRAGTKRVKANNQSTEGKVRTREVYQGKTAVDGKHYGDPDGTETVTDWRCSEGCVAAKLGRQSGLRDVSGSAKAGKPATGEYPGGYGGYAGRRQGPLHNDKGTAARFYHQAGWEHEREEMGCSGDCPAAKLDKQAGERRSGSEKDGSKGGKTALFNSAQETPLYAPLGETHTGASRFYAQADWSHEQEEMGCSPECPVAKLGEQSGQRGAHGGVEKGGTGQTSWWQDGRQYDIKREKAAGDASQFYHAADWSAEIAEHLAQTDPVRYCPKAAKRERNDGLDDFYWRKDKASPTGFVRITEEEWKALGEEEKRIKAETGKRVSLRAQGNIHPTIKPISLCKWLATLLLPPKEYAPRRILIPFAGKMSEAIGALLAGWEEITAVEMYQDYCDAGEARLVFWNKPHQLGLTL